MLAISAEREDPWWNRNDPWWHPQATWSGGTGAPAQEKRVTFAMNADGGLYQSPTPGGSSSGRSREEVAQSGYPGATPPGFSEPSTASTPAWQPAWQLWTNDNYASSRSYTGSEFRPDLRNWKEAQLDLSVKPEIFKAWQLRALRMLSDDGLDIRRLLDWAEKHDTPIDSAAAQIGARHAGL